MRNHNHKLKIKIRNNLGKGSSEQAFCCPICDEHSTIQEEIPLSKGEIIRCSICYASLEIVKNNGHGSYYVLDL